MRLGRVGRCEVWIGEDFRVGHGDVSSCPVWQGYRGSLGGARRGAVKLGSVRFGYRGSSAVRLGMVGHGEVW